MGVKLKGVVSSSFSSSFLADGVGRGECTDRKNSDEYIRNVKNKGPPSQFCRLAIMTLQTTPEGSAHFYTQVKFFFNEIHGRLFIQISLISMKELL